MKFEEQENTLHCFFSGDLNTDVCASIDLELRSKIHEFMEKRDQGQIVFDLSGVPYISSAFLRLCLIYCKAAGSRNFRIEHVSPDVFQVFTIAGFVEMMNIVSA